MPSGYTYCFNPQCPQPQNPPSANFCGSCGTSLLLVGRFRATARLGEGGFGRTYLGIDLTEVREGDVEAEPTAELETDPEPELEPDLEPDLGSRDSEATALISSGSRSARLTESGQASQPQWPTVRAPQGKPCVIKQIYLDALDKSRLRDKRAFDAEAERLRKLGEHPQIPRLIAAVETQVGQFLVQDYAPGRNLAQWLEAEGPWGESQVRSLLESLVPVLQYVHSFDIIHRDIKPENIIWLDPGKARPMLVDFGAAKRLRNAPAQTVIGSASYAAPEQSMGQATFASDIYSLGLTCLNLLTGIHPFSLYSAAEDRWVWQDFLPQSVTPRFAQILDKMVARTLQARYENFDQVALDLQFSRGILRYTPRQVLKQAKKSVAPLKRWLPGRLRPEPPPVIPIAPQAWQLRHRIRQPLGVTRVVAVSPKAPIFAIAGSEGSIRLGHLPSGELIHTFHRRRLIGEGHSAQVSALAFHPDGRALYSASSDGTLKEWDSQQRCLLNTLPVNSWRPTALAVLPDGRQLISANYDGRMVLWDIATLTPVAQLNQHQRQITSLAVDPRGRFFASASDDGSVKLWKREGAVSAPEARPDGRPPIAAYHLAKSLDLTSASPPSDLPGKSPGSLRIPHPNRPPYFGEDHPQAVAIALHYGSKTSHPAGNSSQNSLIVATSTGSVWQYGLNSDLSLGPPIELYRSPSPLTALALSARGQLAIGSQERILSLWEVDSGECLSELAHDWGITALAFSPDGQTLITASEDEVISLWQYQEA